MQKKSSKDTTLMQTTWSTSVKYSHHRILCSAGFSSRYSHKMNHARRQTN